MVSTYFELFIKLIEAIIWPVTLLLLFFIFRKQFATAMTRLGSIKADASGISMTFEKLLADTQDTFKQKRPLATAKNASIAFSETPQKMVGTPYQQAIAIKNTLVTTVTNMALEHDIPISHKNTFELLQVLTQQEIITPETELLMRQLLTTIDSAPSTLTAQQLVILTALYNAL